MSSALTEGQGRIADAGATGKSDIEVTTMRKVMNRLVPFLMFCYFINYLDRANISVASLQMNPDLKLTSTMFGFGAGLFFLGYCIFEVPSNLLLYKFGARRWIARIMLTWGLCATGMAFIQGEHSFYAVRFLLGAAEAGFQPGVFFFLTLWFPAVYRARVLGLFFAAIPISFMIGSPISGMLLSLDGAWGLRGWQWLYIIEGLPAIVMAPIVAFYLQDRVADAKWLAMGQREWLDGRLQSELQTREKKRKYSVMQALTNPWVLFLGAVYFSNVCLNNATGPFLPQIVKSFGLTNTQTGFVSAIPYLCALICVVWWGRRSDRHAERYGHAALATFIGGAGLLLSVIVSDPMLRLAALAVAVSGTLSFAPVFWSIAPSFLSGAAAAGGLAFISAMGIVGGWLTPFFVGYLKDATGSFTWGLGSVAVFGMLAGVAMYVIGRRQGTAIEIPAGTAVKPN